VVLYSVFWLEKKPGTEVPGFLFQNIAVVCRTIIAMMSDLQRNAKGLR